MYYFYCYILTCCIAVGNLVNATPSFSWSNLKMKRLNADELRSIASSNDFGKLIESEPKILVYIQQNQLSLSDFSKYADVYQSNSDGGVFKNLKSIVLSGHGLQIPSPSHIDIKAVSERFGYQLEHVKDSDFPEFKSNLNTPKVIVINMPTLSNRIEELLHTDKFIKSATDHLKSLGSDYLVLFSGENEVDSNNLNDNEYTIVESDATGRHILSDSDDDDSEDTAAGMNYTFINVDHCIYFYAKQLNFTFYEMDTVTRSPSRLYSLELPHKSKSSNGSACVNSTGILKLDWKMSGSRNLSSLSLNFAFMRRSGMAGTTWEVNSLTGSYTASGVSRTKTYFSVQGIKAPLGSCFYCRGGTPTEQSSYGISKLRIFEIYTNASTATYQYAVLDFVDLQIEALNITSNSSTFSSSVTYCNDYFSVTVITGLLVFLTLLIIFTFGLSMLAAMQTPIQFDDPRGKTITINASSE